MDDSYLLQNQLTIHRQLNPNFQAFYTAPDPVAVCSRSSSSLPDGKADDQWERDAGGNIVAKRNARERTRVHTVNQAFHMLKGHLPSLRAHTKRVSKLKILRAAINYIDGLSDMLKQAGDYHPLDSSAQLGSSKSFRSTSIHTKHCETLPMADRSLIAVPSTLPYMQMPSLLDYPPQYMYNSTNQSFLVGNPFIIRTSYPN